jgi:thiol-disulfide isomerase/thioredoxin
MSKMTRVRSLIVVIVAASALSAAPRDAQDVVGRRMPVLEFDRWVNTPGGEPLDTSGRVTLYRWWTDGCEHCDKTLPAVEALRKNYSPKGLVVVAVYHPKPPRNVKDADVRKAAAAMGYTGPIALDLDWSELKRFYLDTASRDFTSASFLVDKNGVIRHAHAGPRFYPSTDPAEAGENAAHEAIERAVKRLLPATP